jgi:DNA-binding cell septation regulator SpoVG
MKVEVIRFTPFNGQSSLKGFAEVKVADKIVIRDIRLVQVAGKEAFVSPPQKEYTNREGEKKYTKLVEWPQEWDSFIRDAVFNASQDTGEYQEPPQRQQYAPQGRQDSYQESQAPRQQQRPQAQPRRTPAPPPDEYEELEDPFAG